MGNISWAQFGIFIAIATALYYAIILLFFHKNNIPVLHKRTISPFPQGIHGSSPYSVHQEFTEQNNFIEKRVISKEEYIPTGQEDDLTNYHHHILLNEAPVNTITPAPDNAATAEAMDAVKEVPFIEEGTTKVTDYFEQETNHPAVPEVGNEQAYSEAGFADAFIVTETMQPSEKNNLTKPENSVGSVALPVVPATDKSGASRKKTPHKSKDSIMHLLKPTVKGGKQ
jgi:hypothetical protein